MLQVTKREKILIVILILLIICVCIFVFLINPFLKVRSSNQIKIQEALAQKMQLEALIAGLPATQKQIADGKTIINNGMKSFYPVMKTWEAERIVTDILKKNGITVVSVDVNGPTPFVPLSEPSSSQTTSQTTEKVESDVKVMTIAIAFESQLEPLKSFLDEVANSQKKIAIDTWTYSLEKDALSGTINVSLYCMNQE